MPHFIRPRAGDIFQPVFVLQLIEEAERLNKITGDGSILPSNGPDGIGFALGVTLGGQEPDLWIKITGVGADASHYAWSEQIPGAGGTFSTGPRSGTTLSKSAKEINGNLAVPVNNICPAWLIPGGGTPFCLFQTDSC